MRSLKQFAIFLDPYYWRTAILIARSGLARQYRNSYLGMAWTLLQPLTMVTVYAIIMPILMRFPARNYVLYILSTLPLWGYMYNVFVGAGNSLVLQSETLKRCMISSTVFPIADVLRHTYTCGMAFITMYVAALLFFGLPGSWHVLLLPLYIIPVVVTIMAAAVAIAFVTPYIRDIVDALVLGMSVMIWFSAVVYPIEAVPENLRWVFQWNPFYIILQPVIMLVYEHTIPGPEAVIRLLALMLLAIAVSYALYRRCRDNFVYYL